jgi:hypothetical protein
VTSSGDTREPKAAPGISGHIAYELDGLAVISVCQHHFVVPQRFIVDEYLPRDGALAAKIQLYCLAVDGSNRTADDPSASVPFASVNIADLLGQIGHSDAIESLKVLLNDENEDVAEIAMEAVEQIESVKG